MPAKKTETKEPCWNRRIRFMYGVNAFCMASISYVLWYELDTSAADTTVTMGFLGLITTMGSFVFGAVWQDITKIKR